MKIQRLREIDELESFGNYSDDIFLDSYLWNFISEVKKLSVQYNNSFTAQIHLEECLEILRDRIPKADKLF